MDTSDMDDLRVSTNRTQVDITQQGRGWGTNHPQKPFPFMIITRPWRQSLSKALRGQRSWVMPRIPRLGELVTAPPPPWYMHTLNIRTIYFIWLWVLLSLMHFALLISQALVLSENLSFYVGGPQSQQIISEIFQSKSGKMDSSLNKRNTRPVYYLGHAQQSLHHCCVDSDTEMLPGSQKVKIVHKYLLPRTSSAWSTHYIKAQASKYTITPEELCCQSCCEKQDKHQTLLKRRLWCMQVVEDIKLYSTPYRYHSIHSYITGVVRSSSIHHEILIYYDIYCIHAPHYWLYLCMRRIYVH